MVFECALPALVEVVTFRSKNSSSTCMEGAAGKCFVYSRVTVEFLLSYKSAATLRRFLRVDFLGELFYISLQLIGERRSLVNTNVTDEGQRQKS